MRHCHTALPVFNQRHETCFTWALLSVDGRELGRDVPLALLLVADAVPPNSVSAGGTDPVVTAACEHKRKEISSV